MRRMLALVCVMCMMGCATIMQGTKQEISVSSNPTAATVSVNNKAMGKTPMILNLKRKKGSSD